MRKAGDALVKWGAIGVVLLATALVTYRIVFSPAGIIITQDDQAPWIMAFTPVTARLQQLGKSQAPATRFGTAFFVATPPVAARLEIRAFGDLSLFLNDRPVPLPDDRPANWKTPTVMDVARFLRSGDNWIIARIENARGPALLSFRLEGGGIKVVSGPEWGARIDNGRLNPAMIATDVRPLPLAEDGEKTLDALGDKAGVLVALFFVSGGAFLAARRTIDMGRLPRLPWICFAGVVVAWLVLYVAKFLAVDLRIGFDASNHMDYVDFLREHWRVPLATDGWNMFHPPFFYGLSAAIEEIAARLHLSVTRAALLKPISFLAGLGNVWVVMALCRRLFPGDARSALFAIVFAGILPVNIYMAAYFSNEPLHAFLFGCCLLAMVDLLPDKQVSFRKIVILSVLLGLAMLTKMTAALIVTLAGVVVSFRIWMAHRKSPGAVLARLAALALPILLISAWFYVRNILEFGRPLVMSWEQLPGPEVNIWWSHPGFHTLDYYLRFGTSLVQPYLSAFHSFWDALYSSLWGDGFLAGKVGVRYRHTLWNYDFMAAAYPLAIPATLLLLIGWVRAGWIALSDGDGTRRTAFGTLAVLCGAILFANLYLTLEAPFHGAAKASYALPVVHALAIFFALGIVQVDRWMAARGWLLPRAVLFGWLGTFVAVCYLSFLA